jgi:hypothetical protein
MINSMFEYGSAIASVSADEFASLTTVVHDRENFDEPRSAACGADEWATNVLDSVTCPDCLAKAKPNPGSPEAVALGCICPRLDNSRGSGYLGSGEFWVTIGCPVHQKTQ